MSDENDVTTSDENAGYPSRGYAWFVVVLLTIAYIFSYIDRQVLGLLLEPIKADLNLSDTQMGLLGGFAFAIFYATMGIPLGWLADRKPRKFIVAIGIGLWSIATAASGLARSFGQLFLARVTVGVGEASLGPSAMSLISDLFPPESRAKAIALYSTALGIGSGIAYILVSKIIIYAETMDMSSLAFLGVDKPWHVVFLVVGVPGVILSLVFLTVKEPKRKKSKQTVGSGDGNTTLKETFVFLRKHWIAFFGVMLMVSAMTAVAYSSFWLPATFSRTWGWDAATFANYNGKVMIILAPLSTLFWGWLIDNLTKKGRKDSAFLISQIGLAVIVVSGVLFPLLPNVWAAFTVSQLTNVGFTMMTTGGITALLAICPGEIRGQTVAIYYMFISMTGLLIGTSAVAFITDNVFADESMLRYSMAILPLIYAAPILLVSGMIKKAYTKQLNSI